MSVRIMCEGEDGTLFCVENNVPSHRLDEAFEKAQEQYPCGQLWTENEDTYAQAARQFYSDEYPENYGEEY